MMRGVSKLMWIVFAGATLPASAAPGRYAITTERIAEAISNRGVQVSPQQVTLLAGVVASVANPELNVQSIDRTGNEGVIARIACADSAQCLPFFVALHVQDAQIASVTVVNPTAAVPAARPPVFAVRQGATTALFLDGAHVHISLSAICLENGVPGQTIRATSVDRRQVFTVQVASNGTLRGRL